MDLTIYDKEIEKIRRSQQAPIDIKYEELVHEQMGKVMMALKTGHLLNYRLCHEVVEYLKSLNVRIVDFPDNGYSCQLTFKKSKSKAKSKAKAKRDASPGRKKKSLDSKIEKMTMKLARQKAKKFKRDLSPQPTSPRYVHSISSSSDESQEEDELYDKVQKHAQKAADDIVGDSFANK